PVGSGILTMPQRSESTLYLWNRENPQSPVDSFAGHNDVVKEFVWRIKGGNNQNVGKEFQLITWSKDQYLRLWPISDQQLKLIGHERATSDKLMRTEYASHTFSNPSHKLDNRLVPHASNLASIATPVLRVLPGTGIHINQSAIVRPSGASTANNDNFPTLTGPYRTEREHRALSPLLEMQNAKKLDENSPTNVHDEIELVSNKYKEVKFEKINDKNYMITSHVSRGEKGPAFPRINVTFPEGYPLNKPPSFEVHGKEMTSIMTRSRILLYLKKISEVCLSNGRPCLEDCVRILLEQRQENDQDRYGEDESDEDLDKDSLEKNIAYMPVDKDYRVPFPQLCGARFSMNGQLVCFFSKLGSPYDDRTNGGRPDGDRSGEERSAWTYCHPRSRDYWDEYKKILMTLTKPLPAEGDDDQEDFHSLYFRSKEGLREITTIKEAKPSKDGVSVRFYDLSNLMPVDYELAAKYTLNGRDSVEICEHNARVAAECNRPDLEQAWNLASLILSNRMKNYYSPERSKSSYKGRKNDEATGLLSADANYADNIAAYSEKSGFQQSYPSFSLSTTFGQMNSESFNSSLGTQGTYPYPLDSTTSTPSTYHLAHSEGTGGSIMVPSPIPSLRHQRRPTFGSGAPKEMNFFPSSVSTTSSRSPIAGGRVEYFTVGFYDYEVEKKPEKNSDVIITTHFDEFDEERK
ncbi:3074_t:CDS:2, partial [Acaulospora colombiana]